MNRISILVILGCFSFISNGQDLPLLKISDNQQYIITTENKPFFWLGGTAWEMIHRLNREDVDFYLKDRANKGFTVIQTVILAELDGINTPNAYGHLPLMADDPTKLNEKYFEHVDYVIRRAEQLRLYVGLLPTWGDKFNKKWGVGPEIFTAENAKVYGISIAQRYKEYNNIIWILGGDRIPESEEQYAIIRAMAEGIREVDDRHLITYHPVGAEIATNYFNEDWLDINMFQSGHSRTSQEYNFVLESKKNIPIRPVINGESRYENIPDRFWEKDPNEWMDDADVRNSAYWTMISGSAGYTYGCNDIWQLYDYTKHPVIYARTDWKESLHLPGSTQMKYMRELFELFPWQKMEYNQSIILNDNPENESYIVSAVGHQKDFIICYTPYGKTIKLDLTMLNSEEIKAYWFNPRSGSVNLIGEFPIKELVEFIPWSSGRGSDFVLVIMDVKSSYNLDSLNH